MTDRAETLIHFVAQAGWADAKRRLLAGDASNRRYDRLIRKDGTTAVLMDAPPVKGEDTRPFIRLAAYLSQIGLSAPEIIDADVENGFLLLEDFGDGLFADLMDKDASLETPLYRSAMDVLHHLRRSDPIDLTICDANWLTQATDLFFDWYVPDNIEDTREAFREVFYPHAEALTQTSSCVILRDYHAQNLLWLPGREQVKRVGILDFQDALLGHPAYDLVSILQDARRDVPPDLEAGMIDVYLETYDDVADDFRTAYGLVGVQRNLRILGIFARLGKQAGKPHYVDLIPRVWRYLLRNLNQPALAPLRDALTPALFEPTPEFLDLLKQK